MRNYVLGVLSGLAAAALHASAPQLQWYFWVLFAVSAVLILLGVDVYYGSRVEHQERAAWLGLALFGGSGALLQAIVWTLGT
jgi:hypothetical protein